MKQRGFATVALLILMPLIIASIAILASGYLLIKADTETRHLCRSELLKSQTQIGDELQKLMALNHEAEELRAERIEADAQCEATIEIPPAHAEALAQRALVVARQMALAAAQKRLILKARLVSKTAPTLTAHFIDGTLRSLKTTLRADLEFSNQTQSASFDLIATPQTSLTPDYNPSPGFQRRQTMRVSWNFRASALLPGWLRPLVTSTDDKVRAECSATLKKGGGTWRPVLSADKS